MMQKSKTDGLGEKPLPMLFCSLQTSHILTIDRTWLLAVKFWRLTACKMKRPGDKINLNLYHIYSNLRRNFQIYFSKNLKK
jgi:hypothetical protein